MNIRYRVGFAAAAFGAAAVIAAGCTGGGGSGKSGTGGSTNGGNGGAVGRVTSVVTWKMPDDIFGRLTPEARAGLQKSGITIDDATKTMVSPELPLAGHWVKVGDQFCMTDRDGLYTVNGLVPSGGSAPVYSQLNAAAPEGEVPMSSLVPKGQTPAPVRLQLSYTLPDDMNGGATKKVGRGADWDPDACTMRTGCMPAGHPEGNKKPCCLDYDGTEGDGKPRARGEDGVGTPGSDTGGLTCNAKAYVNFINSTCYLWTFTKPGRPCSNEAAVNHVGATCWENHKYRNCQNMDEFDLHVPEKLKVGLGEKVTFTVRNNTAANHTRLTFVEENVPGALELDPGAPSANASLAVTKTGYILAHFDDQKAEHYSDAVMTYTAPDKLPDGKASAKYHLIVEGGGQNGTIEIEVGDVQRIEIEPSGASIKVGQSVKFTATAYDSKGNKVSGVPFSWTETGGAVSVDGSGNVNGVAEGTGVVTVSSTDWPGIRGTATVQVSKDPEQPTPPNKPQGRHSLVSVNGLVPPAVVNEYYDKHIDYTWRMTIFPGYVDLHQDGTFDISSKGGDYNHPVALQGKGTYQVEGSKLKLTYTEGRGPGSFDIVGSGKLSRSYVFKADGVQFERDVPVTELYQR